jgi:hypothetical protein
MLVVPVLMSIMRVTIGFVGMIIVFMIIVFMGSLFLHRPFGSSIVYTSSVRRHATGDHHQQLYQSQLENRRLDSNSDRVRRTDQQLLPCR